MAATENRMGSNTAWIWKQEVLINLSDINIPKDAISFQGGFPPDSHCITRVGRKWEVYFSERGQKTDQVFFDSEQDACEYLLSIAKKIEESYRNCIIIKR